MLPKVKIPTYRAPSEYFRDSSESHSLQWKLCEVLLDLLTYISLTAGNGVSQVVITRCHTDNKYYATAVCALSSILLINSLFGSLIASWPEWMLHGLLVALHGRLPENFTLGAVQFRMSSFSQYENSEFVEASADRKLSIC